MNHKAYKMPDENQTVGVRLTIAHLARADALIDRVILDPLLTAAVPSPSRSLVLRMAMIEGLAVLEARFPPAPRARVDASDQSMSVPCPTCAAAVGAPCTSRGVELVAAHHARRAMVAAL